MTLVLLSFILCAVAGWIIIPWFIKLAHRIGLVDQPDKTRKLHTDAIPLVGGISFFIVLLLMIPLLIFMGSYFGSVFNRIDAFVGWPKLPLGHLRRYDAWEFSGLVLGSAVLLAVGVLDDWKGIRGRQKLAGQILAATVLIAFGYQFQAITIAGYTLKFHSFSIFLVYLWVLAAVNSVNLLDGADGIASSIGVVMSLALGAMMIVIGNGLDAVVAFGIAGSLIAVLRYNFPPAKVYLGDAGSMLIGFLLAAIAIRSAFKQNSLYAFMAPVALLAIPFIDTGAAIIRRRLTGRSIFAVDRGHLHHALLKKGYSPVKSLVWVIFFCVITAVGGVAALVYKQAEFALVAVGLVFAMMAGARLFGFAELRLVTRKTQNLIRSALHASDQQENQVQDVVYHVQGERDWEPWWKKLREFAIEQGILKMTMDLNAPWLHESWHAKLKSRETVRESNYMWSTSIPLLFEKRIFGKVDFTCSKDVDHHEVIKGILEITAQIEDSLKQPPPSDSPGASEQEEQHPVINH